MIGYYVHHQGSGHLHRMRLVAARMHEPVHVLSSLPAPADCDLPWVRLADDAAATSTVDPEARGTLHWVPRHDPGLLARMGQLVDWVERARPSMLVVDVSVEVSVLVRLLGVPVVVVAQPGDRRDRAHHLAYDLADAIVAPWPAGLGVEAWPAHWAAKATHVGAFSRFDGRGRWRRSDANGHGRRGLLLWGTGGRPGLEQRAVRLREATPGWAWDVAGPGGMVGPAHVWRSLCSADVVVSHAGQNIVAELASARAHAVVVADPRPFDEQRHTARAVDRAELAVGLDEWPEDEAWPGLLEQARGRGGDAWARWADGRGAERMARVLDGLAADLAPRLARVEA